MTLATISERAKALHADALVWDNQACLSIEITDKFFSSLDRHKACGVDIVCLNVGFDAKPWEHDVLLTAHLRHWFLARPDDYVMVSNVEDIRHAKREGKMAISFNIEGMVAVEPHIGLVRMFYDLGVRWMLIAYNMNNKAGGGCHDEDCGLTDFGRQVLDEMAEIGMVTCCSHTGYRTAMEVFEYCKNPVIFSHSNPRSLCDHPRNVPDDLMRACAKSGGVMGITGSNRFLGDDNTTTENFLRHLDYAVQLIGSEHVGISSGYTFESDFMKIDITKMSNNWPEGFGYESGIRFVEPEQLPEVTEGMLKLDYSEQNIRGILGENFLRVAKRVWK